MAPGFGFLDSVFILNVVLLVVGVLIGVGIGRALKGLLLIVVGILVLVLIGITVGGLLNLGSLWGMFGPLRDLLSGLAGILSSYPTLSVGLVIGLLIGLLR